MIPNTAPSGRIKILLADDHALFREGLCHVLRAFDNDMRIVEVSSYPEALTAAGTEKGIRLALVDLTMPGMERFAGLAALCDRLGDVPVIVVSAHDSEPEVRRAMASGAAGFIPKALDSKIIRTALETVLDGGTYLPPSMVGWEDPDDGETVLPPPRLTPRQRDVLGLIALGYSNKKIAAELDLAEGTVKLHVAALLKVLQVSNRTEAVFTATTLGLVESPIPTSAQGGG